MQERFTMFLFAIKWRTAIKSAASVDILTKKEALAHETEMRVKLFNPGFEPIKAAEAKQTVQEYLEVNP